MKPLNHSMKKEFSRLETFDGTTFEGEISIHWIGHDEKAELIEGAIFVVQYPGSQAAFLNYRIVKSVKPIGVVNFELVDGEWVECDPELRDSLAALSAEADAHGADAGVTGTPTISGEPGEHGDFVQVPFGEAAKFAWLLGHQMTEMEDGE